MFILFTFTFGDDFYIAAAVLIGIEFFGQLLKMIDFTDLFTRFKEKGLYNNPEIETKLNQAMNVFSTQFESLLQNESE
jgi:hypothetical protein